MNKIELHKGDCLKAMDSLIERGIIFDAIICDPPYGTTACKWDSIIPFDEMWARLNKLIKPNGVIVLFGSEPFSSALRMSNIKNYKYDWVWNKRLGGNPLNAKRQPMKIHETISVFNKHYYYPIMTKGKMKKKGGLKKQPEHLGRVDLNYTVTNDNYYPKSILDNDLFSNGNRNKSNLTHPTQKPVALMEYLIKTYTNENELILDFTMGSATTVVAGMNTNRSVTGIENADNYFDISENRVMSNIYISDYDIKVFK